MGKKSKEAKNPKNEAAQVRRPQTRRGVLDRSTVDSLLQLQLIKSDLEKVSLALVANEPALDSPRREEWAAQLDAVDLAILRARAGLLNGISAAFETEVPAIVSATGQLAE